MTEKTTLQQAAERDYAEAWDELEDVSDEFANVRPKKDRQLNLRVDAELLGSLRDLAAHQGEGYHTLARRFVEEGLARELAGESVRTESQTPQAFQMKQVLLVLLGSSGSTRQDNEPLVGRTRLQKLLFLAAQHLKGQSLARFEAYDYGPYDEGIEPDVEFLAGEGLVERSGAAAELPRGGSIDDLGAEILAWVKSRPQEHDPEKESYRLTQKGMDWVRRFFDSPVFGSSEAKESLALECRALKERYGRVSLRKLVDYVYTEYPEFTKRSKIRHQVAERVARQSALERRRS
jgi:predicted DNA binding CopG/RHH family protein/DNA-binding PadR family transcriptional regulator